MSVPVLISGAFDIHVGGDFDVTVPYSRLMIVCVTLVLMIALTLFISHSRMGRACRACAEDMKMANLLGIDTNRVISFTFVLGAMLAAVGGVLIGLTIGKLNPYIGFVAGIKAFTAAVLGGIGSIRARCSAACCSASLKPSPQATCRPSTRTSLRSACSC